MVKRECVCPPDPVSSKNKKEIVLPRPNIVSVLLAGIFPTAGGESPIRLLRAPNGESPS